MRRLFHISVLMLVVMPLFLHAAEPSSERKKVAVVLSGGGAKGVAHIGALRVIEEAGIPIDIVVGTSMGAIVGGLYSIGYTPAQLDSMVMTQDWGLLLSDRTKRLNQNYSQKENEEKYQVTYPFGKKLESVGGLIKGTNLEMLFNDLMVGYHDSLDFRRLPIPFACVAADIVDGQTVVMREGVLSTAMRASMAIPGVFTPVYLDEMVLVDGGVANNFPTDIAREMGADIIIGVDVQSSLKGKDELVSATDIIGQIIDMAMQQQTYRHNVALTDVFIKVDVEGYSSASFNIPAIDSLVRRGGESAKDKWDELVEIKREIGIEPDFVPEKHGPFVPLTERGDFRVYKVSFEGLSPRQRRWVMHKCRISENCELNVDMLDRSVSILGMAANHSGIYYSLRDTLDGYNLDFHMDAIKGNSLSAGVGFDSEEIASVIVNGTFRFGGRTPQVGSVTGRFGKRLGATLDYSLLTSPLSSFKLAYTFNHNDINIYSNGKRYYNPTYNHHLVGISFINMNFLRQSLRMELGTAHERFYYVSWLTDYRDFQHEGKPLEVNDERFWLYFAKVDYESRDSRFFSTRGTAASVSYQVYTDNFLQYKGQPPFSALAFAWRTAIPVSRRFSLIPSVYGRVLFGTDIPFSMLNMAGGKYFGRYVPHQMPFDGIGYMEAVPHAFFATKIQARQRIMRRHYVSASFNFALADNELLKLMSTGKRYFGASVDYGYDLRNFPIQASLGWSNATRSVGFYFQAGYTF